MMSQRTTAVIQIVMATRQRCRGRVVTGGRLFGDRGRCRQQQGSVQDRKTYEQESGDDDGADLKHVEKIMPPGEHKMQTCGFMDERTSPGFAISFP